MATVAVPCNPATLVMIFAKLYNGIGQGPLDTSWYLMPPMLRSAWPGENMLSPERKPTWKRTSLPFELPHPHVSDIKSRIINSPILVPYTRLTIMLSTQWWSLLSFTWSLISVIIIYVTNMIQRTISIPIRPTATPRPAASSASLLQHLSHTFEYNVRSDLNHIYIR